MYSIILLLLFASVSAQNYKSFHLTIMGDEALPNTTNMFTGIFISDKVGPIPIKSDITLGRFQFPIEYVLWYETSIIDSTKTYLLDAYIADGTDESLLFLMERPIQILGEEYPNEGVAVSVVPYTVKE